MQSDDQFLLDFTSRANERCAKLFGLRSAPLPIEMTRGRVEGVIELLQRLTLLCRDLPEALSEAYSVDCQVMAIAARIERRKTVSEKTVRNWTADAKLLGLLTVEYSSQQYGGSRWNAYTIDFARLHQLLTTRPNVAPSVMGNPITVLPFVAPALRDGAITESTSPEPTPTDWAGSGRKRAVTVSAPGAVTASAPTNVFTNVKSDYSPPLVLVRAQKPKTEQPVVVSDDFLVLIQELRALGMSSEGARGAVAKAESRGLTHARIGELVEQYREASARDTRMTAGWLYRWLTGQSSPPKPYTDAVAPKPTHSGGRGDGLSRAQSAAEQLRFKIIRQAKAAGASEDEVRQRCIEAGVEY
jgi:hypothetical protein